MNETAKIKKVKMGLLMVYCIIFSTACGGPFGIETMVSSAGPGMTILMLLVLPFLWANPMGLATAELCAALPLEGGGYRWVQRTMGEFAGFIMGWWLTLAIYVDSSIYIVLAVGYISTFLSLTQPQTWALSGVIIAVLGYINIRGIHLVGKTSIVLSIICILPFIALSAIGLFHMNQTPFHPFIPDGSTVKDSIGVGLAVAMWMYAGYAAIGSVAGEIEDANKLVPKAMVLILISMVAIYVIPTVIGLGVIGKWDQWAVSGGVSYVQVGQLIGGSILGTAILASAISGNLALYSDFVATGTRTPWIMAEDNLFPKFYTKLHPKYGTPWISIIVMCIINMIISTGSFANVIVFDIFLVMFYTIMILLAVVILRVREPDLPRPFRMPGGTIAVALTITPAIVIAIFCLFTQDMQHIIGGIFGLASGPVAYVIFKKIYGGIADKPFDPKSIPIEKISF